MRDADPTYKTPLTIYTNITSMSKLSENVLQLREVQNGINIVQHFNSIVK
jgi:capsular polysaccharide biosynthesis protein